jgi:hypothetical protein
MSEMSGEGREKVRLTLSLDFEDKKWGETYLEDHIPGVWVYPASQGKMLTPMELNEAVQMWMNRRVEQTEKNPTSPTDDLK